MNNMIDFTHIPLNEFINYTKEILDNPNPPEIDFFKMILKQCLTQLNSEKSDFRPRDSHNLPGGLIDVRPFDDIIILPDLHARRQFVKSVLFWEIQNQFNVLELLEKQKISLLCLGDGVHSEGNFSTRWVKAYAEYQRGYRKCPNMDAEIADSFNLMIAIMLLKIRYKERVNFLKGNHENICNETGMGNYAFAKFANEGAMVSDYFRMFYDKELLDLYYQFEKSLPLFVVGKNFLASHAEPYFDFDKDRIIQYREDADLIEALTWTENFSAISGTLDNLLDTFIPGNHENNYYFGGHRPITKLYKRINNNRYVQIHNPFKQVAAVINQQSTIDLNKNVVEVPEYIEYQNLADEDTTLLEENNPF
ncbi:MAG: calcineurin [Spirochaetes bacterium]|nr:calcineurin [Spirochaetota bacterium]